MAHSIRTLSESVAEQTGITKAAAYDFSKAFVRAMRDALVLGETITFADFGSFSVKEVAARERHNPRTGEKFMAPASARVKLNTAPSLKEALTE